MIAGAGRDSGVSGRQVVLVLLACLLVYWPRLGEGGFTATEGHRVVPAWGMLERGEYLVPRMFERVYLRKPPGMQWAIAASSGVLGETEFAARAVSALSATGMALVALYFGSRWFGRRWGAAAGLAQALMPLMWASGRSAEIEALNALATMAGALLLIDVLVVRRGRAAVPAALAGVSIAAMALAKGPAGAPTVVAAIAASCIVLGSAGVLRRRALWGALVVAAVLAGGAGVAIARGVEGAGHEPVMQGVGEFLWTAGTTWGRIAKVALLIPLVLLSAMPVSLALLFPWGRDARAEAGEIDGGEGARRLNAARAVGLTCVISLAILAAAGVQNPRYGIPSVAVLPVLAAYVARGAARDFAGLRRAIARAILLGSPAVWAGVLLAGAGAYITWVEPGHRAGSGRGPGVRLGEYLPHGVELWAGDLVEARPEVLLYAERAARGAGRDVRVRWMPAASGPALPGAGHYIVLRTDAGSGEVEAFERAGLTRWMRPMTSGTVHKFRFTLYRVADGPGGV